jgi:hypothetical protein
MEWQVVEEESRPHWLEVKDPEGWYEAIVKWDGCIELSRFFNLPLPRRADDEAQMEDHIHICDLDGFIARLQALKNVAREYFDAQGRDWPG